MWLPVIFYSCSSPRTLINQKFPPLAIKDQQFASIERNLLDINDMEPHLGIHIDKEILLEYLPKEVQKAAIALEDENVIIHEFEPTISLEKQGIFIEADFFITVPNEKASIRGKLKGITAVATEGDSIYLRSALSSLKIKSIKFEKKPGIKRRAIAKLMVPVLKNFIDNLNGVYLNKPTAIYAGWGETYKVSLKKLFKDPETEVIADSLIVSRYTKRTSTRIRPDGISVLVELSGNKPVHQDTLINPLTKKRTEAEVDKIFNTYNNKFDARWLTVFEPIDPNASITASVSKAEISKVLNEALARPITLKRRFSLPATSFNEKLEVKRGDIDCQKVRTSFSYPSFKGDACDWNCKKKILGQEVDDPFCVAAKTACKVKRETERVAWQAARETARIAHQALNESKVVACNVQREAMDFMALGRFKGDLSANGNAFINLQGIKFSNDLSEITLHYSGQGKVNLKSNLELNPVDLGHIFFCFANYGKRTESNLTLNMQQVTSKLLVASEREGEDLKLKIKIDQIPYEASISPSPLHALLTDPQFIVQCPITSLLASVATGGIAVGKWLDFVKLAPEQELLLMGDVKGKYEIEEMQIPFEPIVFRINRGSDQKSVIFWNAKSIQFTYFKPQLSLLENQ